MPCVVADTSPLFYLAKLGRFELLRELYGRVDIPPCVWRETLAGGQDAPELTAIFLHAKTEGWLVVSQPVVPATEPEVLALDSGEREAIALARKLGATLLIMDEKRGRAVATFLGLIVAGTLGVLLDAKRAGIIPMLAPELIRLRQETAFRFSTELEQQALRLAGESQV